MPKPDLTGAAALLAAQLPTLTKFDTDANAWAGHHLCGAIGAIIDAGASLTTVVEDTDDYDGWTVITSPQDAPEEWLQFQADLYGVNLIVGQTTEQNRTRIADLPAQKRGTPAAMIAAVQATLTGTKAVTVVERLGGNAYRMLVVTYEAETPDATATIAASRSQKPAGITRGDMNDVVRVDPGWSIGQMHSFHAGQTGAEVAAQYADGNAISTVIPEA